MRALAAAVEQDKEVGLVSITPAGECGKKQVEHCFES